LLVFEPLDFRIELLFLRIGDTLLVFDYFFLLFVATKRHPEYMDQEPHSTPKEESHLTMASVMEFCWRFHRQEMIEMISVTMKSVMEWPSLARRKDRQKLTNQYLTKSRIVAMSVHAVNQRLRCKANNSAFTSIELKLPIHPNSSS